MHYQLGRARFPIFNMHGLKHIPISGPVAKRAGLYGTNPTCPERQMYWTAKIFRHERSMMEHPKTGPTISISKRSIRTCAIIQCRDLSPQGEKGAVEIKSLFLAGVKERKVLIKEYYSKAHLLVAMHTVHLFHTAHTYYGTLTLDIHQSLEGEQKKKIQSIERERGCIIVIISFAIISSDSKQ